MDHHRHVDIVEVTLTDKFGLAEHELDFAFGDARCPLLDIDEFFGRHCKKDDLTGKVLCAPRIGQPDRSAQHSGNLSVVAATMRRSGGGIRKRVLRGTQTVELANNSEPRPGSS